MTTTICGVEYGGTVKKTMRRGMGLGRGGMPRTMTINIPKGITVKVCERAEGTKNSSQVVRMYRDADFDRQWELLMKTPRGGVQSHIGRMAASAQEIAQGQREFQRGYDMVRPLFLGFARILFQKPATLVKADGTISFTHNNIVHTVELLKKGSAITGIKISRKGFELIFEKKAEMQTLSSALIPLAKRVAQAKAQHARPAPATK